MSLETLAYQLIGAGAVGWGFKYLIDRRQGLWAEAKDLREELKRQGNECKLEVERLEVEVMRLRIENHGLRNDLLIMKFAASQIPEEEAEELIKVNKEHVNDLKRTYKALQHKLAEHAEARV